VIPFQFPHLRYRSAAESDECATRSLRVVRVTAS
jgi:hypothetical protein